ncbi:MAG: phosphatase PAP2 family protein [Treponema sp.]|nr:phosphatase PAP2 family protein [Treponema sp.]
MEQIQIWGLGCMRLIQGWASPPLTAFMEVVDGLGSVNVYLLLIPFVYWCVGEKKALRMGTALLVSVWLNILLNYLLNQQRPFFTAFDSPAVLPGGFPSGRVQNALVVWMIAASWGAAPSGAASPGKKKGLYAAALVFCLLLGFSRVYLGADFPADVLGGWLLGALIFCLYFFAGGWLEALIEKRGPRAGLAGCAALSFLMILYRPAPELLITGGMFLGLGAGYFLCWRYAGFAASSLSGKTGMARYFNLLVRLALGFTAMALLYTATGKIIAALVRSGNFRLFVFLRFALTALWASAGAPLLFRLLRLAENKPPENRDNG